MPQEGKEGHQGFGVRKGENIACVATIRGPAVDDFLKRAFESMKYKIKESCFDDYGNVSFGISEHINMPGTKYDPTLGIFGMNVCVVIERPGYRVSRRSERPGKIGRSHRVSKAEAIAFMKDRYGLSLDKEE